MNFIFKQLNVVRKMVFSSYVNQLICQCGEGNVLRVEVVDSKSK
jgi:hypothetical protein